MVKLSNTRSTPKAQLDKIRARNKEKLEAAQASKVAAEMAEQEDGGLDGLEGEHVDILPKHVGGGMYELPDGTRIKGKEAALAAFNSA